MALIYNFVGLKLSGSKVTVKVKTPPGAEQRYKGVCHCGAYFYKSQTQITNAKKINRLQCDACNQKVRAIKTSIAAKPTKKPTKYDLGKAPKGSISLQALWESLAHRDVTYGMFYQRYVVKNWPLKKALTTKPTDAVEAGRRSVTSAVTAAATGYLIKKGYGVYRELSVKKWGARRVDVCGVNLYGYIVVCEVKSGMADYRADKKMHEYLPYCNKMYVAFPHTMKITEEIKREITSKGIGIMVLETNGLIRVRARAKHRLIQIKERDEVMWRMVWRGAVASARTTRRTKEFL